MSTKSQATAKDSKDKLQRLDNFKNLLNQQKKGPVKKVFQTQMKQLATEISNNLQMVGNLKDEEIAAQQALLNLTSIILDNAKLQRSQEEVVQHINKLEEINDKVLAEMLLRSI